MYKSFVYGILLLSIQLTANAQPHHTHSLTSKDQGVLAIAASPDGKVLVTAGDDHLIRGWNLENHSQMFSLAGHNSWILSLAFSNFIDDGRKYLASGAKDGTIIIYDYDSRSIYYQTKTNNKSIYDLIILDKYSLLVAVSGEGKLSFIDLDSKNTQDLKLSDTPLLSVDYLSNDNLLVVSDSEGVLKFIDPVSRSVNKIVQDRSDYLRSVSVIEDKVISVGDDKAINIRDINGNLLNSIEKAHKKWIQVSQTVGDDIHFLTGGHDGMISLWSKENSENIFSVKHGGGFVSGIALNNDLTQMFTSCYGSNEIKIWDISNLKFERKEVFSTTYNNAYTSRKNSSSKYEPESQEGLFIVQPYYEKGDVFYCLEDNATIRGYVNIKESIREFKIINVKTQEVEKLRVEENNSFEVDVRLAYLDNNFNLRLTTTDGKVIDKSLKYFRIFNDRDPAEIAKLSRNGRDYALIIATNSYKEIDNLINPVFDANAIANELEANYGFIVEKIIDPPLDEIKLKIREYSKKMFADEDQLFIFIAGHGEYDDFFKEGYIVATDSKADDEAKSSYLPHSTLRTYVNNIPCKHIMLTMDVCFGGTFDPAIAKRGNEKTEQLARKIQLIRRKLKYVTRLYITSGGKEYVPDGRPGHHSPFARKFLESLRTYGGTNEILTSKDIFSNMELISPEPRFGEFGDNEPGSDFIFIYK